MLLSSFIHGIAPAGQLDAAGLMATFGDRLHWLVMHGFVRAGAKYSARKGDSQARFVTDPAVRADPIPF